MRIPEIANIDLRDKPLVRWTIGDATPQGYECLAESIRRFTGLYDVQPLICHNCDVEKLDFLGAVPKFDQRTLSGVGPKPAGVAWKLCPTRLAPERHELLIDSDIILERAVPEIDRFFNNDCTLLLGATGRTYGRFERHVAPGMCINSGIYGMPPSFDLQRFVDFYAGEGWEVNALGEHKENVTFDEQGLVAFALLSYRESVIIPHTSVTDCSRYLDDSDGKAKGFHFIGLNRWKRHRPYRLYRWRHTKSYL